MVSESYRWAMLWMQFVTGIETKESQPAMNLKMILPHWSRIVLGQMDIGILEQIIKRNGMNFKISQKIFRWYQTTFWLNIKILFGIIRTNLQQPNALRCGQYLKLQSPAHNRTFGGRIRQMLWIGRALKPTLHHWNLLRYIYGKWMRRPLIPLTNTEKTTSEGSDRDQHLWGETLELAKFLKKRAHNTGWSFSRWID